MAIRFLRIGSAAGPGCSYAETTFRAALEEWVKHLDELGIAHSPIQDDHQPPSVTFSDPDGIALELSYPKR